MSQQLDKPGTPLVSVLCTFRNEAKLIGMTIASINEQTFADFEVIFVDNASTDGTADIVRRAAKFPFRMLVNDTDRGLVYSLNRGLEAAEGVFVARIDADDLMLPNRLERQVEALRSDPDLVLLGGQAIKIDDDGQAFGRIRTPLSDADCRFALNFYASFVHPAVMYRRDAAIGAGGYVEAAFPAEDYDFWCRLAKQGRISNLDSDVVKYRVRTSGSITSSKREIQLHKHAEVIDRYLFKVWPGRDTPLQLRKLARLAMVMPMEGRQAMVRKLRRLAFG